MRRVTKITFVGAPDVREVLGIHWCPRCGCDTMPNEHTGECFFCDKRLCVPAKDAAA